MQLKPFSHQLAVILALMIIFGCGCAGVRRRISIL